MQWYNCTVTSLVLYIIVISTRIQSMRNWVLLLFIAYRIRQIITYPPVPQPPVPRPPVPRPSVPRSLVPRVHLCHESTGISATGTACLPVPRVHRYRVSTGTACPPVPRVHRYRVSTGTTCPPTLSTISSTAPFYFVSRERRTR